MLFYKDDLIDTLRSQKINFVAYAVTLLHVVSINATIKQLQELGIELNGLILMMSHGTTGKGIKQEDFRTEKTSIKIVDYVDEYRKDNGKYSVNVFKKLRIAMKKSKNRIYTLWTSIPFSFFDVIYSSKCEVEVCFIQLDDGGSSYANMFTDMLQIELYEGNNSLYSRVKAILKTGFKCSVFNIVLNVLKSDNRYIDNRIFIVSQNKLEIYYNVNERIVPYYRKVLINPSSVCDNEIFQACSGGVLINTQCLLENNITDGYIDLHLYHKVIEISQQMGYNVALKPHPRELDINKYSDLGACIVPTNLSQEMILANLPKTPKCIISIFSSTLLNAHGLFNIPAISLAKIILQENVNSIFEKQLRDYIKQYKNVIIFPETFEELKLILRRMKDS